MSLRGTKQSHIGNASVHSLRLPRSARNDTIKKESNTHVIARNEAISTQAGQPCKSALYSIKIASYLAMTVTQYNTE